MKLFKFSEYRVKNAIFIQNYYNNLDSKTKHDYDIRYFIATFYLEYLYIAGYENIKEYQVYRNEDFGKSFNEIFLELENIKELTNFDKIKL